jgi:hypothetical protein
LNYRLPDGKTRYEISIENPSGHEHGVREAKVDGQTIVVAKGIARIPLSDDGKDHRVIVRL